jgi:hypothetical protein
MFGFSITKLLVLVAVVAFVVIAFKVAGRRAQGAPREPDGPETFDTEYDRDTDSYVVRNRDRDDG